MLTNRVSVYENQHLWKWKRYGKVEVGRWHIVREDGTPPTMICGYVSWVGNQIDGQPQSPDDICGSCARIAQLNAARRDLEARR